MFISFKILLLASFTFLSLQSTLFSLNKFTQETIRNNWQQIKKQVAEAEKVIVTFSGISQYSLNKLLALPMPKLKILSFGNGHIDSTQPNYDKKLPHRQYLTHKMLKTIFTSQYLPQIQQLNLVGTNIDDNYWKFIDQEEWKSHKLKIRKLLLGTNLISSYGFKRIAKYEFDSLDELDLSGNLLIQSQAIDAVLNIICGNGLIVCRKKLASLDISSTSIKSEDFLRLIQSIDTESLITLNISRLNLHQKNKYHQGFDLTTYTQLAKMNFSKLKHLQMADLALDQTIISIFSEWKFPQVEDLYLQNNFMDDKCVKLWINKQNFPKLKRLILAGTDLKDEGLKFIVNQGFNLEVLNLGLTMLSPQGLSHLLKQDTSKMKKLFLKDVNIQSQTLELFFKTNSFQALEQLSFTDNKEIGNLFKYFPWKKLQYLKTLILTNSYIDSSFSHLIQKDQALLPHLQNLILNGTGLTSRNASQLLQKINILFPSLKYIDLCPQFNDPINLTALQFNKIKQKVEIDLGYTVFERVNNKISLKKLKSMSWLALYSSLYDLSKYIQPITQHYLKLTQDSPSQSIPQQLKQKVIQSFSSIFSIEQLNLLTIKSQLEWELLKQWIKAQKLFNFNKMVTLYIEFPVTIQDLSNFLQKTEMPILRNLHITLNITKQSQNLKVLIQPLSKYVNLIGFKLLIKQSNSISSKRSINHLLNRLKFPFLLQLDLSFNNLETQQIGGILYNHAQTVRFLKFNNNFLEKSFLKLISSYDMKLLIIDISFISFSKEEFKEIGGTDFGFLADFKADNCGLTDDHILKFIQTNKNHRKYLFPKIGLLSLNQNQIREKGVKSLFQESLLNLLSIRIKRNYNPHFLNILLTYTSKITELLAVDVEIYALSNNLQPISTRRIRIFGIQTYSFSQKDYQILGTLNFKRLKVAQIQTRNMYECQNLKHLLMVSQHAKVVWISFNGDSKRLTSQCLNHTEMEKQGFQAQVEQLAIHERTDRSFIPVFAELFLSSKRNWRQILLQRLRLPPSTFMLINPKNLDHLKTLYIGQNYIDDAGFSRILQSPLQNLQIMRIGDTAITMKSLSLLENRTFQSLEHLDLRGLPLGESGVEVLTKVNARKLKILILDRCGIKSLKFFSQMKFPLVYQLFFSYNDFQAQEFINFLLNFNRKTWPSLWKIQAKGYSPTPTQFDQLRILSNKLKIQVDFDKPHHIQFTNSAKY